MRKNLLILAALGLAAAPARAQAQRLRPAFSSSQEQLQRMVEADLSGSAESMAAKAAHGPDGEADRSSAAVIAPGAFDSGSRALGRAAPGTTHGARDIPAPARMKNPFPRSEDAMWVGAAEAFLEVERIPLSFIHSRFAAKLAGAVLFIAALAPALLWIGVRAAVASRW